MADLSKTISLPNIKKEVYKITNISYKESGYGRARQTESNKYNINDFLDFDSKNKIISPENQLSVFNTKLLHMLETDSKFSVSVSREKQNVSNRSVTGVKRDKLLYFAGTGEDNSKGVRKDMLVLPNGQYVNVPQPIDDSSFPRAVNGEEAVNGQEIYSLLPPAKEYGTSSIRYRSAQEVEPIGKSKQE